MNVPESLLYWGSTLLLGGSFFLSILTVIFARSATFRLANRLLLLAFLTLSALGALRWIIGGHPPFVSLFESMLTGVWFTLLIFIILRFRSAGGQVLLPPVAGITLLLMGWSASLPRQTTPLSAALDSVWLFIHASFATAGAATFLIGASFGLVFLMGDEKLTRLRGILPALPARSALPRSMERFLLLGLVLWGVMIVSGSIWAHSAWGRYWAWDPIELWSLISWLLYGALFHARLAFRLPPRAFAILSILAVLTVVFALWGVHYAYETIHTYG